MKHGEQRVLRVGISGSYGGMNLGDEAILTALLDEIRQRVPAEIVVFSRDPDDTAERHRVERAVPVRDLSRTEVADEISGLDLFILGGGGILYDGEARVYLREAQIASEFGVPVMTWAIGAGPLNNRDERRAVREVLSSVDLVTVRDNRSRLLLEDAGVQADITVTADPALCLKPEPFTYDMMRRDGLDPDRPLIGMSIREPGPAAPDLDSGHYHALLANVADFLVDRMEATVVFVPMERTGDLQQSHGVVSRMAYPEHAHILKGVYSSRQILGLMPHFEFAIGMRLHFLIFATISKVPFVPLPYASKVEEFVREMGMPMLSIQRTNAGQLLAHVDRAWDMRDELRVRVEERMPDPVERATRTPRMALELLTSKLPDHAVS
jgi:polysaccharide pyruvyl transferase CsaB